VTDGGAHTGTRNEFIHYIQDTPRQHEIVGPYMKWSYELRAPEMIDGVLRRAMQLASTPPEGPVYLTGAREVWEGRVPAVVEANSEWRPARLGGLPKSDVESLYQALTAAKRPIVITAYLGRQPESVPRLVALSDWFGVGVCEVSPQYVNFPGDHPHHLSYRRNTLVDEADLILMLDVDVPWINSRVQPARDAQIFHIDVDPVKPGFGYWHFTAQHVYQADCACVLEQLLAVGDRKIPPGREQRLEWIAATRRRLVSPANLPASGPITAEELTAAVRELVTERTILLFEEPASTELIPPILRLNTPGSFFHSGGSGLGFAINGAVGAKLARPDAEVISLVGDGCYLFGVPSSAYWVARAYGTPHLTVIYNNGGWHSPKLSTQWVHPDGVAQKNDTFWVTMGAGARLADIAAAAGDAEAYQVETRDTLKPTLRRALETVRAGRCAVVDVAIAPISQQVLL
jgi:acetolactate synthase-1/2/3 large subunit